MVVHNDAEVSITYRVVGNTGFRVLSAGESAVLTGLPVPVNFFVERNDQGLTTTSVEASPTENNMIEVTVDEALYPDAEVRSILVNETG
ncbi:hypothetical protein C7271_24240 [filamentous cyanobacterium CCP5]|nr:hypothetical protein C7271_24240 [filamentous cyanobacterium CCP5]